MFGVTLLHILIDVQSNSITTEFKRNPGSNLVAYYSLNGDWKDHKSDFGYTGIMYDCTMRNSFSYSWGTGKVGNCLKRTSSQNASLNTGITLSNKYTIMFWLKNTTNAGWGLFAGNKASDGGTGFSFQFSYLNPGVKIYQSHYYADNDITLNTWNHYVLTQDGTTAILYVNGVGKTFTVNSGAGGNNLQLLGIQDSGTACEMDEVYVFDGRTLTQEDINKYLSKIS